MQRNMLRGTNIVLLEPDIAEAFPNDQAVNQALWGVLNTTRAVRGTGGLADKSLQPAARRRSRRPKRVLDQSPVLQTVLDFPVAV